MKIREIKNEIEALGFGDLREMTESLPLTLSRVMSIIEADHPRVVVAELPFFPKRSFESLGRMENGGVIEVAGGNLEFKLSGKGKYRIIKGDVSVEREFSTLSTLVSLDFPEGGSVVFGEGNFTVYDIRRCSPFPAPLSDAVTRLHGGYEVNLKVLFPNLVYLTATPTDSRGKSIPGMRPRGANSIFIPEGFLGTVILSYRKRFSLLDSVPQDDDELDAPEELLPLIALLSAYYLWLDDEPEKAEEYLKRYKELSASLKAAGYHGGQYKNESRWA